MPAELKYVDPNRSPGLFSRVYASFANTRLGRFMSVHIVWRVDPHLMRATRGRLGLGLVMPTALLDLQAHPDVSFGGISMRATVVGDETERARLWLLADRVFAPYAAYRREAAKANRTIPIVRFGARESGTGG